MTSAPVSLPSPAADRLPALLQIIADHPWCPTNFLQIVGGWSREKLALTIGQALKNGLIEQTHVPIWGARPPLRLGLTRAGADQAGHVYGANRWRRTLLCARHLDSARLILSRLYESYNVLWSFSPYTLPRQALLPVFEHAPPARASGSKKAPLMTLPLDVLAGVEVQSGAAPGYINVAIVVDPGDINLDWFEGLFRSFLSWHNRPEFVPGSGLAPANAFPVLVVVAANTRRQSELGALWRKLLRVNYIRPDSQKLFLRLIPLEQLMEFARTGKPLDQWRWTTEHAQSAGLWPGIPLARQPSARPLGATAGWWGDAALTVSEASRRVGLNHTRHYTSYRRGILVPAGQPRPQSASSGTAQLALLQSLVPDHLQVSLREIEVLKRIGLYPLIRGDDLAVILGWDGSSVHRDLRDLRTRGLIEPPEAAGQGLTWRGLALLAYQAGFEPNRYAALRGWPVKQDEAGHDQLSLDAWLAHRQHTEITLAFLVGLCRFGPPAHLRLAEWDHTPWPECFPGDAHPRQLIPDGRGLVLARTPAQTRISETAFWLEVDRATVNGRRLTAKLARYYAVGGPRPGMQGRAERLLIVVPANNEGRLRLFCRRFRKLDQFYAVKLDVRITRLDLLDAGYDRINPTLPVWRTPYSSTFLPAFNVTAAAVP